MSGIIYIDNNATTKTDPEVFKAMEPYFLEKYANPSGVYSFSRDIKSSVEEAREKIARFIGAEPAEIIFTAGGTEADNMAIKGVAYANKDKGSHIITAKTEHHAVLNTCKHLEKNGFEITYLPVDKTGLINIDELKNAVTEKTILITIMWANNEIGTIQPVKEIASIAREKNVYFHTDAVQAAGKIPIDVKEAGIGLLSLSAHKFYGPKGVGVLYAKKGVRMHSLMHGGHHERNKRAGTENVPGIIGMAKACEKAGAALDNKKLMNKTKSLRDRLEKGLAEKIPEVIINGHPEKRVDNTLNICVKYIEGESMLIHLDMEGICASSGSACTSGSLDPSHVLLAIGLPHEIAHGSIRFSFGKFNEEKDVDRVLEVLPPAVEKLRNMSPLWHEYKEKKI